MTARPHFTIPNQGTLVGTTVDQGSERFAGIPYASADRFRRPVALPASYQYGDREYTSFQPICHQPTALYTIPYGLPPKEEQMDEDCLYLNIWRPSGGAAKKPILFYIHGGWLQVGSAYQDPSKDFSNLVKEWDCIVVCPAYRLNVFGFLALEGADGVEGNFGFWDQRAALEWTAANAAHFGGDADKITLAGLSAGAQSTHAQALHEYSRSQFDARYRPLIRRCLIRSGSAMVPSKGLEETRSQLLELCSLLDVKGKDDAARVAALRTIPAAQLVSVIPRMKMHTFRSVKDGGPARGGFVGEDWIEGTLSGAFSRWAKRHGITFVIGECADEDQLYRLINAPTLDTPGATNLSEATMIQLNNYYPTSVLKHLLPAYPTPNELQWQDYHGAVTSDAQVFSAQRLLLECLLSHEGGLTEQDVLTYRLERRAALLDDLYPSFMGVFHGSDDMVFCYRTKTLLAAQNRDRAQEDVSVFKKFLEPIGAWVGGAPQEDVVRAWYGETAPRPLTQRRILRTSGELEISDDPIADSKAKAVAALRGAMQAEQERGRRVHHNSRGPCL